MSSTTYRPGKVIIYDEVWARNGFVDEHGSHLYPPDDNAGGARFVFVFSSGVTVHEIGYLDIEESETTIDFFFADGTNETDVEISPTGDAKMRVVDYNSKADVIRMEIYLPGSGAVTSLNYTEPCKPGGCGGDPHIQLVRELSCVSCVFGTSTLGS